MLELAPNPFITVSPFNGRVTARFNGEMVADSTHALALKEEDRPLVYYVPREDVEMDALQQSDHTTRCPYKGRATHYTILTEGGSGENAAWSYEDPIPAAAAIAGHIAFYGDRVEVAAETGEAEFAPARAGTD